MTVTACHFVPAAWRSTLNVERQERQIFTTHRIECNSRNDGPLSAEVQALSATPDPLPTAYEPYSQGNDAAAGLRMMNRQLSAPTLVNAGLHYYCTSTFRSPGAFEEGDTEENPLLRPVKYWLEWAHDVQEVYHDRDGTTILNFAKRPYPEEITLPVHTPILCARLNIATVWEGLTLAQTYVDAVNSDTWYGAPPRYAKCESITTGQPLQENDYTYYECVIRVHFLYRTWDIRKIEEGWEFLQTVLDDSLTAAIDGNGNPAAAPVKLRPSGTRITDPDATPYVTTWRVNREVPFAGLPI